MCPTVTTIEHDPGAEMARFERVAVAVETLIPRIEVVAPGLILAPVTGAVRYFGGEQPLVDRVAKEVDVVAGTGFRLGLAAGPFASRRAAEYKAMAKAMAKHAAPAMGAAAGAGAGGGMAKALKDHKTEVKVKTEVDCEKLAQETARLSQQLFERLGGRTSPWQRRAGIPAVTLARG